MNILRQFAVIAGMALLVLGCGGGGGGGSTPVVVQAPTALSYSTNPAVYIKGVAISPNNPTSSGGAVTSYSLSPALPAGLSLSATAGTLTGTPTVAAVATAYTVIASNSGGSTTATLTITVNNPVSSPVINSFTAAPTAIGLGAGSILSWDVTGATALSINNSIGTVTGATGTVNITPLQSTSYTLTATNTTSAGTATATATATVVVDTTPFSISAFSAADGLLPWGGSTTLSWALRGVPVSLNLNGSPISGTSTQVRPVRRQDFTLAGSNASGSDTRTVTVAAQGLDLIAGSGEGLGYKDGVGGAATFAFPIGVASDRNGNVYVADQGNSTIRMVAPNGTVTTVAGSPGNSGSTDGNAASARFQNPLGLAVDAVGNIYVADTNNSTIRRISAGVVTTLAGSAGLYGTTDGIGSSARFGYPYGLTVDASGNIYIADNTSYTIRKLDTTGRVTTVAGSAGAKALLDGAGTAARFYSPRAMALDSAGNLYIADYNAIRKMTPAGVVTTLAGSLTAGSADGAGTSATFSGICGIALDAAGNLYVTDGANATIRKVTTTGIVTTLAGSAGLPGYLNGSGSTARFHQPWGITTLPSGNLAVADESNCVIRTLTTSGTVGTLAGTPRGFGSSDGTGSTARFSTPVGLAMDTAGNTYVADYANHTIRKVTPGGVVTTVAGSAGLPGSTNGVGSLARFKNPNAVAVDSTGILYVADYGNHTIRRIALDGTVTTLAGVVGAPGMVNGLAASAKFYYPCSLVVGTDGTVYVADTTNNQIRTIRNGYVATLAGSSLGYMDGYGTMAQFSRPTGITIDSANNLYIADASNSVIRKIDPYGLVSTLAGNASATGSTDGTGTTAQFNYPYTLAVGPSGDVFVNDSGNQVIRRVTPLGKVTTVAGTLGLWQWQPGPLPGNAGNILGIAVSAAGDIVLAINDAIVQVTSPASVGVPTIAVQPQSYNLTAGQSATLSVIPSGIAPFTYQWSKNAVAIVGATAPTYALAAVTSADNGSAYRVVVSNAYGSVTSSPASIGVITAVAPVIMMQPASQSIAAGETTTFTVVATSFLPMTYQWSKNGSAISGATSPSYTIPAASTSDNQASYSVSVGNSIGSTASSSALLTVIPSSSTLAQAIIQAKSTMTLLVNTRGSLGTSFFPTQTSTIQTDLAGANASFSFYGRNLKWLRDALKQLTVTGGTSLSGTFDTGYYYWSNTTWGIQTYPFTLNRSGSVYSYSINGGTDGTWGGTVQNLTTWPDGSIQTITLVNASFPGDMTFVYTSTPTSYTYRYAPIYSDLLNVTLSTTPSGTGSDQSITGNIQRIPKGALTPSMTTNVTSATWTEYASGATTGQNHAWLPKHVGMTMTTGTYSFTGTMDCTAYQTNPTAAAAVYNGPSWGWPALNSAGSTFTAVHFTGASSNGQGGSLSVDLTINLGNYQTLLLNQPLSATNAPVANVTATGSLQTPNQPLMTLTVATANQGIYQVPATLKFTYGTTILSGTGTYYPVVAGQASGLTFYANLKDQAGTDIVLQLNTSNVLTGTVSYGGATIGTISDVGFGPRVSFIDGTFQTLW